MKIWITGIAGFLGSHLAETLITEGHEVRGNDNLICGDDDNIKGFAIWLPKETDCRNYKEMLSDLDLFKPDVLVHCAATAHEGLSSFSPSFITKNIYEASVATFSAAIASGVKRIVYMSSMSRYGRGSTWDNQKYKTEADWLPPFIEHVHRPAPVDPYGVAKVAAEDTLRILCNTHDVKYSILVPHNIIGIRQRSIDPYRNVVSIMINRCKSGNPPIIYGDGEQVRSFSPVADCLPSIVKAVHGAVDGEVVNIGPDSGEMSIKELAYKIIKLTGYDGHPIYMDGRPNEVIKAYCSSDKARRMLGYEPKQSIYDCLKEMVEYIKPEPFKYDFPIEINTELCPATWRDRLM